MTEQNTPAGPARDSDPGPGTGSVVTGPVVAGVHAWVAGARPRTLPAAVVPVAVGTGVAAFDGHADLRRAALALVVSLAIQVGVNYANDYSDGIRGTDDAARRVGPVRLVGWGLARPSAVKRAAFLAFGVAAACGLALALLTSWWLIAVGAAALAAAWFYTGGPRPYGYAGFGEPFVFVFFGLVAVIGTVYVQTGQAGARALTAGIGVGALAVALMVANNLRDIPGDTESGKRTLAVRLGDQGTRRLYVACLFVGLLALVPLATQTTTPWPLLGLGAAVVAIDPMRRVARGAAGRELIAVLAGTARTEIVYGVLTTVGLLIAARST